MHRAPLENLARRDLLRSIAGQAEDHQSALAFLHFGSRYENLPPRRREGFFKRHDAILRQSDEPPLRSPTPARSAPNLPSSNVTARFYAAHSAVCLPIDKSAVENLDKAFFEWDGRSLLTDEAQLL